MLKGLLFFSTSDMKFNTSLSREENFAHACGLALDIIREHMVSSTAQTLVKKKKSFIAFFGFFFKSDFTYWCIAVIAKYLPCLLYTSDAADE